VSPHEWIRQFVNELRLLRPRLTDEMLELIASAFSADGDPKLAARSYHKRVQEAAALMPAAKAIPACTAPQAPLPV
jgi:hypothetical protein